MKNFRHLLTLILVSICAVQSAWADRSAPELPEAVTPESGQTYYLYNVMEGKFWCRSTTSTTYPALGTYGDKVTITATGTDNEYYMQWASNNYYLYAQDSYINSSSSPTARQRYFTISESSKGYTIQRSPNNTTYYKADEFIGYNHNNGDRLNPALAEGSIHWQFMTVDEAEHYFAKHKLYTYLEAADSYNFVIDQYDIVYNNPESTTAELNQAQEALNDALTMSRNFVSPDWTEYPILFQNSTENKWTINSGNLRWTASGTTLNETSTLIGTIDVDEDVTLVYKYSSGYYINMRVYVDGDLVQNIANNVSNTSGGGGKERRYYIELPAGKHNISWTGVYVSSNLSNYRSCYLSEIGIQKTPTITPATTTVEGQLGTEVLKLTDNVANVKKIVITGVIGADDWTTIGMMKNAFTIDMSGATTTAGIPESMFKGSNFPFLHSFKLPQGLTSIGAYAFSSSDIEDEMTFPSTLQSIGYSAFYNSKLKAAYMQDGITSIESSAFSGCLYLENASYPATCTNIPERCFYGCKNLRAFDIPEGVTYIGKEAFKDAELFKTNFPSSLKTIVAYSFENTGFDRLVLNEGITCGAAFNNCNNLIYAEFPTTYDDRYTSISSYSPVANCSKLKDVYFKSPTVVEYTTYNDHIDFFEDCPSDITIHVPEFLVSAYKLHPYWYNYNIVGFNTEDITDWNIKGDVTLQAGDRFGGTPNITMIGGSSLKINGDDAMTVNNFKTNLNLAQSSTIAKVISNTNNINITGQFKYQYYTEKNKWYFISLPFDVKVSNITSSGCSHAVRYYDGATRAVNGNSGNWKNYSADDVIPAGTGFIYQTSADCWSNFVAEDNTTKNYVFSTNEFVKSLAANQSEVTANKGWNLVGNPWLSYYNIHKVNFTAPITVWNTDKSTYTAYSIIDDDYAILPSQAFFVQCPDEVSSISFPIDGRQLTSVIESQSGARQPGWTPADERRLMDIELSNGEQGDKTRLVVNPQAKMDYETTCDASKFLSLDASVPQIYTIQDGEQMAINERPAGNGMIKLGVILPSNGTYTIKSERNALTEALLVDNENGTETNLAYSAYTFSAPAGATDTRFELHLSAANITGISNVKSTVSEETSSKMYNLNGQRVSGNKNGIYVVDGKKVILK